MSFKPTTRDALLKEARDRGQRWGVYKYQSFGGHVAHYMPPMLDEVTNREAHQRVADIVPLDSLGEAMVLECYSAARDAFNDLVKEGKLRAKLVKASISPVIKR